MSAPVATLVTMTATCDGCRSEQVAVQAPTLRDAHAQAARLGWRRRRDGADLCPHCAHLPQPDTTGWGRL